MYMYNCTFTLYQTCFIHYAAVFFLEFWKRRQFFLQYDWDMLGYEDAEVSVLYHGSCRLCNWD